MKINLQQLDQYVEKGLLRKAEDEQLVQYNYTEFCNNENMWDDITAFNRGNIYEKGTGELIAQSMPKFMNFSQLSELDQQRFLSQNIHITEKKDGCLGILYLYNNKVRFNSRGGFNNYVTEAIKRILPKYIMVKKMLEHNTLCVEVISPQTKIICDYGNEEELYLLSVISKNPDIGELPEEDVDLAARVMRMPRPEHVNLTWEELFNWQQTAGHDKEGFVVCIDSKKYNCWERCKIKSEDYMKIVKLKMNLSKYRIWKMWKDDLWQNKNTLQDYINGLPDEFSTLAKQYYNELKEDLDKLKVQAQFICHDTRNMTAQALDKFLCKEPLKSAVFNIRNGKPIDRFLIKMIEPFKEEQ